LTRARRSEEDAELLPETAAEVVAVPRSRSLRRTARVPRRRPCPRRRGARPPRRSLTGRPRRRRRTSCSRRPLRRSSPSLDVGASVAPLASLDAVPAPAGAELGLPGGASPAGLGAGGGRARVRARSRIRLPPHASGYSLAPPPPDTAAAARTEGRRRARPGLRAPRRHGFAPPLAGEGAGGVLATVGRRSRSALRLAGAGLEELREGVAGSWPWRCAGGRERRRGGD
jgi:hypothetical protein